MKKRMYLKIAVMSFVTIALFAANGVAYAEEGKEAKEVKSEEHAHKEAAYPLDICPISGEKLGSMGAPTVRFYEGREVRFCCDGCIEDFEKDLDASLKKLDQMIIAKQKANYPLDVCLVSGGKLTQMGEPIRYVHDNQLVQFCCKPCVAEFEKNPGEYMEKLQAAYAVQKKDGKKPKEEHRQGEEQEGEGHHGGEHHDSH